MCGLFDEEDDGYTREEREEHERERERRYQLGLYYRRGVLPGQFGFMPFSILIGIFFIVIGFSFIFQATKESSDPANDPILVLGCFIIAMGTIFPLWALDSDTKARKQIAQRREKRDKATAKELGFDHEPRARPIDEDEGDTAWIPGKTRLPQGSVPDDETEVIK